MFNKRMLKGAGDRESKKLKDQIRYLDQLDKKLDLLSFEISMPLERDKVEEMLKDSSFKNKGVYIISFNNPKDAEVLRRKLSQYRESRTKTKANGNQKEAVVSPNKNPLGQVLYVGKVRSSTFKSRLKQHLIGEQSHRTTSLRMMKWLHKNVPKVKSTQLTVTLIPVEGDDNIRVVEKALWLFLKPIMGEL